MAMGRLDILGADGWVGAAAPSLAAISCGSTIRTSGAGDGSSLVQRRWRFYDVNGDGLNDVVTGLEAHGFGLAWFEQKRAKNGDISFVQHMVMDGL